MAPRDLQLTPEAPWPGPAAYAERDAAFFHGRAAETAELHRLIHAEPVSVLYALSGLGKTSLLCAGVFPRLRAEGWLPVRIRLDHRDEDDDGQPVPALTAQVLDAVAEAAMDCGVAVPEWDAEKETLAGAFHARGGRFWGAHEEEPVTPVLVFDQFEECWTLTRDRAAARGRAEALLGQVAALLDWRGTGEPAPVRVVFALREDQLAPLDALRPLFPGLRRARLRLLPFTAAQAREVVELPGRHLLAEGATEAIVETFAASDAERPVADPALLSIFCWQLNERRGPGEITAALAVAMRGEFVRQFYESAFAALPAGQAQGAHRFVETDLIDAAGFRTSAGFEHAEKKHGITAATLEHLVDARLLHPVDRSGGHRHVELVHDRIAEEAARQRSVREEAEAREREAEMRRQEAEEAAALEAETRRREAGEKARLQADLAKARRRALLLGALALLALAALVFAVIMARRAKRAQETAEDAEGRARAAQTVAEAANEKTKAALADAKLQKIEADKQRAAAETATAAIAGEKTKADQARDKAVAAKKSADELISFMQYDLRDTLGKVGRLDMMKSISDRIARYHEDHPPEEGDEKALREKAIALSQGADIFMSQGDLAAALRGYKEAKRVMEQRANQDPGNAEWQRDLSLSYNNVGVALAAGGDGKGALESYRKGFAVAERLSKQDPGNAGWLRNLSVSYERLGDALAAGGDGKGAMESYRKGFATRERLSKQDPGNAEWQHDLSVSYERLGLALAAGGDGKGALESYRQSFAIRERLAKQDPGNAQLQRSLGVSYGKLGDALAAGGDNKGALESCRQRHAIAERLSKQGPGNAGWQRDLSVSYERLGLALAAGGDGKGALESYRQSFAIRERLAKQDPGNAEWLRDLSNSYYWISQALEKQGDLAGALAQAEALLKIDEKLSALDPTNATWQKDVKASRAQVARLLEAVKKAKK